MERYRTINDINILNKLAKVLWDYPLASKQTKDPLGHTYQEKDTYFRTEFTFELEEELECCNQTMESDWNYCPYCGERIEQKDKTVDIYENSLKEAREGLMQELGITEEQAKGYGFTSRVQVRKDVLDKLSLLNNKQ